jgi:hypothetical protein
MMIAMHLRRVWLAAALLSGCRGTGDSQGPGEGEGEGDGGSTHGDPTAHDGDGGGSSSDGSGGAATAGADGTSTGDPSPAAHFDLPALAWANDGRFATSIVCAQCHSNTESAQAMRDELGEAIAPDDLWQGTMMANSARDPFWWAMVRAETVATPSLAAEIEAECTQCHAPMASIRADLFGGPLGLADLLDGSAERSQFGLDGVACAACHQVPAGDVQGPPLLAASGEMYGPHAAPFTMPMSMNSGFTPVASAHMDESAMCGTCHTLRTQPHAPDGTALGGLFTEQAPYLEWRNSVYTTEVPGAGPQAQSCQGCHMPSRSEAGGIIATRIARRPMGGDFPPIGDRSPYHRHVLVGGNTLVPAMIRDFADELRPRASAAAFDAVIAATRAQLQERTAMVTLPGARRQGELLVIPVRVENLVGHKLPSGIPSRRAFVQVTVRDAAGAVVFRSGATDDAGRILDRHGNVLPLEHVDGPIEPHHTVITDDAQVQIYEAILQGAEGDPVWRLLRATDYAKDSRLLPLGWSPMGPHADETAPRLGGPDADFVGGADALEYRVAAPAGAGPYAVAVELVYQPIGARFAAELLALDAPEIRAFERIWDASDRSPEPVATASVVLP